MKEVTRLFTQFHPTHYELEFTPDRENMTFHGTVKVTGKKVGRPSQRLTFHQNGLKIVQARVVRHDKKGEQEMAIDRINNHNSHNEVRLHATEMLYPGEYVVTMVFEGTITRNMEGIYPCFFTHNGQEKKLIATQFESHHARDAFPCIDEPEAKATFQLTLNTPKGEAVISNTPVQQQHDNGDMTNTLFEATPKMSTYLLAFVFGDMSYTEAKAADGTLVRVYATPDNVKHTDFALQTAVKTLEFYNQYFDIPYPLSKCDFIALPDFASGAMENWGCITFREQGLLVDAENTSVDMKQYVANVIAHELTHQWFGNLVTMRWWTDLWLNEAFASWMSYLAVDDHFPEWQIWPQFISDDQAVAFRADALEHTHPISVAINHPDEIRTIFDSISYDKGASVLHMLFRYLGAEAFRDGLRHYLKKFSYDNTEGADLWDSLATVSGKPVREFMDAWITQSGFPIVRAEVTANQIKLSQHRFYLNPDAKKTDTVWPVPLLAKPAVATEIFDQPEAVVTSTADTSELMLNDERSGLYRTAYDTAHLERLGKAISEGRISAINRYSILSDTAEAARAGFSSSVDVLKLLTYYRHEDNPIVWDVIAALLGGLRGTMDDDELREAIKPYVRSLVAEQLDRLGYQETPGEPHFDTLLRSTVIALSAGADDPETLQWCQDQFASISADKNPVNPDFRGIVYTNVAYHGDEKVFDRLLEMHNASSSSEERLKLTAALTDFKQPELVKRSLGLITTDNVRLQDLTYWIAYSFGNRYAKHQTWQWLQDNWQWLETNIGNDLSFYRMPIYAARSFSDRSFLKEYHEFFDKHMKPAFERNVKQGAETIQWQAAWRARDLAAVKAFFADLAKH